MNLTVHTVDYYILLKKGIELKNFQNGKTVL